MPSYGLGSKAFQQMIPSYLSTIIPLLFFKRVLPFQKIKSNLLDALNLLIQTSVPFSSVTTPSLSSNIFLLSFEIHFREIFLTHSVLARHSYTLLPRFYIIRYICIPYYPYVFKHAYLYTFKVFIMIYLQLLHSGLHETLEVFC